MKWPGKAGLVLIVLGTLALVLWMALRPAPSKPGLLETSGRIEGDQAAVGAKVGGKIVRLAVREGERLAAGALVAELASEQVLAQLQQAKHVLHTAQEEVAAARARAASAERRAEAAQIVIVLAERGQSGGEQLW